MKSRTSVALGVALIVAAVGASLWISTGHAQTITAPTPITPYDWQCQDASGAKLTDHTSYADALVMCWNNRAGDRIQGGAYKLPARTFPNRPPTITGTPLAAIEAGKAYGFTPEGADPDGDSLDYSITNRPTWAAFDPATGTLTGTPTTANVGISSSIVITVTDGKASASTPAFSITITAPPVVTPTAPTLAQPTLEANATNPDRYNILLSWSAIEGATSYEVRRCTGVNCTGYTLIKTVTATNYSNTNLPAGYSYKFEVRAMKATVAGPMSNIVTIATPTTPPPPPPPPPPPGGIASLEWSHDGKDTAGGTLTDLAGFRVIYGTAPTALTQLVTVANPALRSYVVDGLTSGTWYFAVRAYTSAGIESTNSNIASKAVP